MLNSSVSLGQKYRRSILFDRGRPHGVARARVGASPPAQKTLLAPAAIV